MNKLTTTGLLSTLIILTLFSCNDKTTGTKQFNINGSWYADLGNGGTFDSLVNYGELYVTDTTFEYQEENFGQHRPRKYYIKNDSIYKEGDSSTYIQMFKIIDLKNDTLWLSVNRNYLSKNKKLTELWVRLPKEEKGYYDHTWTEENTDSLEYAVVNDYHRRMWRYHSIRLGGIDYYDSLVKAGNWDWNMNQIREADKKEKEYLEKMKNSR
jgi:hypothetical protein